METLFSVNNLSIAFPEDKGLHTVVNDISFEMEKGQGKRLRDPVFYF